MNEHRSAAMRVLTWATGRCHTRQGLVTSQGPVALCAVSLPA